MKKDTRLLQKQLELINRRWPHLYQQLSAAQTEQLQVDIINNTTLAIDGIQLTSAQDREAEAKLQADQISPKEPVIYLYGSALGDCAQLLLRRKTLKRLHIIILNRAVFLESLARKKQDWPDDLRVELHIPDEKDDLFCPFIVNPAELVLAEEKSFILRDRLELEINSAYIQKRHNAEDSVTQKRIAANQSFLAEDRDISFFDRLPQKTVFIAAAGPTLEDHLHWLAEQRPPVIAVDAAVPSLLAAGIIPQIVVAIDAHASCFFTADSFAQLENTPLVYLPGVDSQLLAGWRGERYFSWSTTPMYRNLPARFKKTRLFSSGSVIHPAIDLARWLGAQKIVLLGADFSFVGGKSHASPKKSEQNRIPLERAAHFVINNRGEKVPTIQNFKGYLRDLERYIESQPQISFFTASDKGAKIMGTKLWKP